MLTESWVEGKSVEEKDAQPTERTAALWGLSSKIDSRIWVNFTRNGLRLGSRHQEPPHTDVSRNLATVVVRGVLPEQRRRRTGLLPSGPKSSFQIKASFVFHLETKVLESGGRVEKLIAQVAWSPVISFHSLWWFGVQCHLLVLVHCVFWKPTSLHPFTTTFWSTSCFLLLTSFLKMLISFSSRIWHLPTLPKAPKVGSMTMVLVCLTGQQNNRNLIFFGSPVPALALAKVAVGKSTLGKNTAVRRSCPLASVAWTASLTSGSVTSAWKKWLRDRMAASWSWITSPVA